MSAAEALRLDIRVLGSGRIGAGESSYISRRGRDSGSAFEHWLNDIVNRGWATQFMRGSQKV